MQLEAWSGNKVYTCTVYSGDVGTQVGTYLHLADGLAVDAWFGDEDTAGYQLVAKLFPVHLHLFAQQGYDRLLYGRMSHNEYHIVLIEHGMSVDYLMVLVAVGTVNL